MFKGTVKEVLLLLSFTERRLEDAYSSFGTAFPLFKGKAVLEPREHVQAPSFVEWDG
jgi:hypothetical protein